MNAAAAAFSKVLYFYCNRKYVIFSCKVYLSDSLPKNGPSTIRIRPTGKINRNKIHKCVPLCNDVTYTKFDRACSGINFMTGARKCFKLTTMFFPPIIIPRV